MKQFFVTLLLLRAATAGASWVGYTMHTRVEACKSLTPSRRFGHVHALMVEDPEQGWKASLDELHKFADSWGNSNAPMNTPLGRWCATQRRLNTLGQLVDERVVRASPYRECDSCALCPLCVPFIPPRRHIFLRFAQRALDNLGFLWDSPTDIDDPTAEFPGGDSWDTMCDRFAGYRQEYGDGQVPKKFNLDPVLGGWVAAVRRRREALGASRVVQLEALGFEWVSTRQCGSAFMETFRELRCFYDEHGHTEVARVLGETSDLARWCDAQRSANARGLLPDKRQAYLEGIGFAWCKDPTQL
jgi:hypothetical protein